MKTISTTILMLILLAACSSVKQSAPTESVNISRAIEYDRIYRSGDFRVFENPLTYYIQYKDVAFSVKKPAPFKRAVNFTDSEVYFLKLQNYQIQVTNFPNNVIIKVAEL